MREVEIPLPENVGSLRVPKAIESALTQAGLSILLRGTLKKYPGCLHWHAKNGKQSDTLEVTYWPEQSRAWLSIQEGRAAAWIDTAAVRFASAIKAALR